MDLARLRRNQRMVVYGCAGSGKTMLAVEHAKRLAKIGREVLFVCFNKGLAEHLKATEKDSGVHFSTFHGLCARLAGQAKIKLPHFGKDDEPPPEYFSDTLPDALLEAVAELGPQYDALLVDEAQDLHDAWYEALTCALRDDAKASIWLFMDDNQRIYEGGFRAPPDFFATELDVNCRNTQEIHSKVSELYAGEIETRVLGPAGRPIELHQTDDQAEMVAGVLERLCGREEVPTQDVVVLSAHGWEHSAIAHKPLGRFRLTTKARQPSPQVRFSSIRGFKGLESPVVILCELEDLDEATRQQQLYVGMSRAKNHCVVVVPKAPGRNQQSS
jgi:superfamily I DNA/RNA helicase